MNNQPVVLYVEDDAASRRVMKLMLQAEMGLQNVTIFEDSKDFTARVAALAQKPDVIMLDIHVDPYSGFDMLKLLREMGGFEHTPIIALTASVMNEEVHKLKQAGFDSIIPKPVDMDTFPSTLWRILGGEAIWRVVEPR